jgi:hypothetical protein
MSRKNHIHTMDALIYGYSNFTRGSFTIPADSTREDAVATPMAFDETDNRFTPAPVFITPTMETVKPDIINPTPTYIKPNATNEVTTIYQDDVRRLAPIRPPAPAPFVPIIDIITPTPTYIKPDETPTVVRTYEDDVVRTRIGGEPYHAPTESITRAPMPAPISISEKDQDRNVSPIVNIINPSPYIAPPLIIGGGAMGGGAMSERKPLSGSVATKPSFIKKHFIPILLIASAIYVFIKKPIK